MRISGRGEFYLARHSTVTEEIALGKMEAEYELKYLSRLQQRVD